LAQVLTGFTGKIINGQSALRRSLLRLVILRPNAPCD
jgi:hypothetical protein